MPQRESPRKETLVITTLGSVNERIQRTELPDNEWSSIVGTFPQLTGAQSRVYGKRVLAKYGFPIFNFAQFWSPLGYAGGVYQFQGTVDFGKWITPIIKITIPTIAPSLPFDGGGYTVDDFGGDFGGVIDVTIPNVCIIDFATVQTTHQTCGVPLRNVGTPNDSNGGPAGQGTHCRWVQTNPVTGGSLAAYTLSNQIGSASYGPTTIYSGPPPGPFDPPTRVPLGPIAGSVILVPHSILGTLTCQQTRSSGQGFVGPNIVAQQSGNSSNQTAVVDLSSFIATIGTGFGSATLLLTVSNDNGTTSQNIEVSLDVDFTNPASYTAITLDPSAYLPGALVMTQGGNGLFAGSFATINWINLYVKQRVCS